MSDKTIHILMFGVRRTGKSSVLASMINSFKEVARDTNFRLRADANTSAILDDKLINLREVFDSRRGESAFTLDEHQTASADEYVFTVSYQEKKKEQEIATLEFHDFAGENIADEETAEMVRKSEVLLVAVDTVHLMEEDGKFSSVFHKDMMLKNIVANGGFADEDEDTGKGKKGKSKTQRLVLFVPLKCEKYYQEHRMDEVAEKVKERFPALMGYLTKPNLQDRVTVAVTPILTMGSLVFDHFERDANGKVVRQKGAGNQNDMRPAHVYYKFTGDKTFRPKYCEQPVLYILSFVVNSAKKAEAEAKKKKHPLLGLAFDAVKYCFLWGLSPVIAIIWMLADSADFKDSYEKISVNLKKRGDGYTILQNPLSM